MTAPVCRDCAKSEGLEWRQSKAGGWYLVEVHIVPHRALCKKRVKNGKPGKLNGAPLIEFGKHTSAEDQERLLALLKEAEDAPA